MNPAGNFPDRVDFLAVIDLQAERAIEPFAARRRHQGDQRHRVAHPDHY